MAPRTNKKLAEVYDEIKSEEKKPEVPAFEIYSGKEFKGKKFVNTTFAETELAFADFSDCEFTDCNFYAKKVHHCNFKNAKFFKTVEKTVTDPKTKAVTTTKEIVIDNPLKDCDFVQCYVPGCNVKINKGGMYY